MQVTFDAGRLTSDGGVLMLTEIERRFGIAEQLAGCIEDPRAPERIGHGLAEMICFRALLIAAGLVEGHVANTAGLGLPEIVACVPKPPSAATSSSTSPWPPARRCWMPRRAFPAAAW